MSGQPRVSEQETASLKRELALAVQLVQEAGTIVQTFYNGSAQVEYKLSKEPVTEADRAANQHIVSRIHAAFPTDGILAEESQDDLTRLRRERVWIVDPLDGTKEFIARNGEFSIMIGLALRGQAVLGVVYQPTSALLYTGIVGQGAFLQQKNGKQIKGHATFGPGIPLSVSDRTEQMLLVSSRSHRNPVMDRIRRSLQITNESTTGSVGLKVGHIIRCLADLYIHPGLGCKEWDLCAPEALLRAAGGIMTDCWGNRLQYNKRDVQAYNGLVASNGHIHKEIIEKVSAILAEAGFNDTSTSH